MPDDPFLIEEGDHGGASTSPSKAQQEIIRAMNEAGIDAEMIYVFSKTGIFRATCDEEDCSTPEQQQAWDDAVNE